MNWITLNDKEQLEEIILSNEIVVIFKHSTRCPVSSMAKRSLEYDKDLIPENLKFYYLDLIANRNISNTIAETWNVRHESPQILIVQGNTCLYDVSHSDIDMEEIIKHTSVK